MADIARSNSESMPIPFLGKSRLFIPLSLGNHYYSNERLKRIFNEIASLSAYSCFFVCDELRRISYYARGVTDERIVSKRVDIQLQQTKQTFHNCGFDQLRKADLWSWADLPSHDAFSAIYKETLTLLSNDDSIKLEIVRQAPRFISISANASSSRDRAVQYQIQYFALETALSIYMNEIVSFDYEVYRRSMGFIDYIYATCPDFIKELSGGNSTRKVLELESIWGET